MGGTNAPMTAVKSGLREFEKVSSKGWDAGVPLDELLARVNRSRWQKALTALARGSET